jgi:isobutyryl-CoA mutase
VRRGGWRSSGASGIGRGPALQRLQEKARRGDNLFADLMDTVKVCSLGQITQALFEVGGQYRRNM